MNIPFDFSGVALVGIDQMSVLRDVERQSEVHKNDPNWNGAPIRLLACATIDGGVKTKWVTVQCHGMQCDPDGTFEYLGTLDGAHVMGEFRYYKNKGHLSSL